MYKQNCILKKLQVSFFVPFYMYQMFSNIPTTQYVQLSCEHTIGKFDEGFLIDGFCSLVFSLSNYEKLVARIITTIK